MESIAAVQEKIAAATARLGVQEVSLPEARGRFLAVALHAERPVPMLSSAAMDGYAVRSSEARGCARLVVAEQALYAGGDPGPALQPGQAARIFTGAFLPPLADAVIAQELAQRDGGEVVFRRPAAPGENVRNAGEDAKAGEVVLVAGTRLGARQLGLCAALGVARVAVVSRPRVALVATGDEIARGQIPDSNSQFLSAAVEAIGELVSARVAGDDVGALARALDEALGAADIVLTTGGVSVGERDCVAAALGHIGAPVEAHGVAMKPGKPFLFAARGGKPVFGLPGSPSACLVAFEVFARPALLRMAGAAQPFRRRLWFPLAERMEGGLGRARFAWGCLEPSGFARALGRDIAQVRGPALADVLISLPAEAAGAAAGERVECWLLEEAAP